MKSLKRALVFVLAATAVVETSVFADCRVVSDIRIDSSDDISKYEQVCEAQNVTVFADGQERVILPNLKRAGLVNIDSRGLRAVAMPALEQVRDLYVQGVGVEVVEFPALQYVTGRLVIQNQPVKFLNLPELNQVGRLIIHGCANLEFIFADKLQSIGSAELAANSKLNASVIQVLENVTILSPEQYAYRQDQAEKMRLYRQQLIRNGSKPAPIRPTGHPTHFRDYMTNYYVDYPAQYHDYWYSIGPWGFWLWHRL